jgi:hypothetical protein
MWVPLPRRSAMSDTIMMETLPTEILKFILNLHKGRAMTQPKHSDLNVEVHYTGREVFRSKYSNILGW